MVRGLETRLAGRQGARRGARGSAARRESLKNTALRFLGVPYLWGGTTPKGFDCSGLVQRVFRLNGILIPRDSDMQARFGRARTPGGADELRGGELLFFGNSPAQITHVAISLSEGLFVHAHGQVRINALLPDHPLFDGRLTSGWRLVWDPL